MWTEFFGLIASVAIVGLACYVGVVAGRRTAPDTQTKASRDKITFLEEENRQLRTRSAADKESRDFWREQSMEDRRLLLQLSGDVRALAKNNGARALDEGIPDPPSVGDADASVASERRRAGNRARDVGLGRVTVDTVDRDTRPSPTADREDREEDEEDDGN